MRAIAKWEEVPIFDSEEAEADFWAENKPDLRLMEGAVATPSETAGSVSYTHLRAHETPEHLVCRLLLEKKKTYP